MKGQDIIMTKMRHETTERTKHIKNKSAFSIEVYETALTGLKIKQQIEIERLQM
jgi:hypothetical protein